jgi:hypothetical protein
MLNLKPGIKGTVWTFAHKISGNLKRGILYMYLFKKAATNQALRLTLISFLFIAILSGCSKNNPPAEKPAILFQLEYINHAWGYQHAGYIIDGDGNILRYKNPEAWNFPSVDSCLTPEEVSDNMARCTSTGKRVPPEELFKYSRLIKNLSLSEVSAVKNVMSDAGSTEYLCFRYSEKLGKYRRYIIKKEGNSTCENLNFFSKRVSSWMKNLNDSLNIRK